MPSAFGHVFTGTALGYALSGDVKRGMGYWCCVLALSLLPDIDVLAFRFGIPYAHPLGHRGFFHSMLFAVLMATAAAALFRAVRPGAEVRPWRLYAVFTAVAVLHGLLDAVTSGGLGVGLFMPFSDRRVFFPWRPIAVSPLTMGGFMGPWGVRVLKSEALWLGLPSLGLVLATVLYRRVRRSYAGRQR